MFNFGSSDIEKFWFVRLSNLLERKGKKLFYNTTLPVKVKIFNKSTVSYLPGRRIERTDILSYFLEYYLKTGTLTSKHFNTINMEVTF